MCSEEINIQNAAFQIVRGGVAPLDVVSVQTCDGEWSYMTLNSGWGLVADVDIESEKWRNLGELRFFLGWFVMTVIP